MMDCTVTVPKELAIEIRGFVNSFATKCKGCMYRSPENCSDCPSSHATRLLKMMDSTDYAKTESYFRQNPFMAHTSCVLSAIHDAGRPILQREMKIPGTTRQYLFWELKKMCQRGYIMRVSSDFGAAYKVGPRRFSVPK